MGIFSRLSDIVNSNIVALLDRAEDPQKIIRLIVQEMEDTLVEVRSAAVRSIADKKELERKLNTLVRERDSWEAKAELAIEKGREDLAKGALVAKSRAVQAIEAGQAQLADLDAYLAHQNEDVATLQAKLDDAKQREAAMIARAQSAHARLKTRGALYDSRVDDALSRMQQVERALDEMDGKVDAYDLGRNGRGPSLSEQFAELETDTKVEDELAALKERLSNRVQAKA